jgi:hypothetical protein
MKALLGLALAACSSPAPTLTYLKGQLHAHTNHSGDSRTSPADAARWYAAHGFDFVVWTDHNFVTTEPGVNGMLGIPGVELTQNSRTCEPDNGERCLLHMNALFVNGAEGGEIQIPAAEHPTRGEIYGRAIETAGHLGGIVQLNHPNFVHAAADPTLIRELVQRGTVLMEIANMSGVGDEGDAAHVPTEMLWDRVLSAGATVWGTATDDAHHYDDVAATRARGETPYPGDLGWVMVHAARDPASIRAALVRGDFYASTGVILQSITRTDDALVIEVASPHLFEFIGRDGAVLQTAEGRRGRFELKRAAGGYVRAVVISPDRQHRAWTQPIFVP